MHQDCYQRPSASVLTSERIINATDDLSLVSVIRLDVISDGNSVRSIMF